MMQILEQCCCKPPADFNDTISNSSLGQKRTAKHKPLVFLNGTKVYKGPYSPKNIKKIVLILFRHEILQSVFRDNVPHNLKLFEFEKKFYFEMDHIAAGSLKTRNHDWITEEHFILGYEDKRNIVSKESQGIMEYSNYLKQNKNIQFGTMWGGFWHFVYRYLLGIGDASLRNVLVDVSTKNHMYYGIDYEDNRGDEPQEGSGLFELLTNKKWSKQHKDILIKMLKDSEQFVEQQLKNITDIIFTNIYHIEQIVEKYNLEEHINIQIIEKRTILLVNAFKSFYK